MKILFHHDLCERFTWRMVMPLAILPYVLLLGCAKQQSDHMIYDAPKSQMAIDKKSALLVLYRNNLYGARFRQNFYLDGKLIGQIQHMSYFITHVKPGEHYLMQQLDERFDADTLKMNFEAGKAYFIKQYFYYGHGTRYGFTPVTFQDAMKDLESCEYRIYDSKNPGWDMPSDIYEKEKARYEKEVKELPSRYNDILKYRGYDRLQ